MYSTLADVYMASPHNRGARINPIDRITIHCVVGQCTAEALGYWFQLTEIHSANYGIDKNGRVLCAVDEEKISICSSSYANDQRAVTIECASGTEFPYTVNDAAMEKLIALCVDICRRNGKTKLLWFGDKWKTLNYTPKPEEMVMTVHRWFSNTLCPGEFLMQRMPEIAAKCTEILSEGGSTMRRFHDLNECPEWGRPTVEKLLGNGYMEGKPTGLDLSEDMLRVFVILDRAGAFSKGGATNGRE